jgi:1-acyl-sn-glycerol-3-phosphate acyltransferase
MKVNGLEHLPTSGAVVLACNHRSNLDPFFMGAACVREVHFMAKAELWKFKPLGWLIDSLGSFPVNRGEADRPAVRRALEVLEGGAVLGLFPEGRRQRQKDVGEIRPGVGLFSLRDGVVTIPMVLTGTDRIVRNHLIRFPKVTVNFGRPIVLPEKHISRSQRATAVTEALVDAFRGLLASVEGKP